jgi:hypothetical protein
MSYNERFAHEKYSRVSPLAASFLKMQASMEAEKSRTEGSSKFFIFRYSKRHKEREVRDFGLLTVSRG